MTAPSTGWPGGWSPCGASSGARGPGLPEPPSGPRAGARDRPPALGDALQPRPVHRLRWKRRGLRPGLAERDVGRVHRRPRVRRPRRGRDPGSPRGGRAARVRSGGPEPVRAGPGPDPGLRAAVTALARAGAVWGSARPGLGPERELDTAFRPVLGLASAFWHRLVVSPATGWDRVHREGGWCWARAERHSPFHPVQALIVVKSSTTTGAIRIGWRREVR